MGVMLDALLRLQDVERELVRLRNEKADKQRAVAATQRLLKQLDEQEVVQKAEAQQHQLQAQRLESEIRQREERIARLRQQLNTTRTTREYAALLTEINTDKADTGKVEEQALIAMQAVDHSKAQIQQLEEQRGGLLQRIDRARQSLEEFLDRTRQNWQDLEQRKEAMSREIPGPTLARFERVAEYHEGDAMAEVQRPNPKWDEFVCGGCHMTITAETVNALMTRDELQTCNNCGRILYLQPSEQRKQAE